MKKFLRCSICGNLVEVLQDSNVPIICCGKPMEKLIANTNDGAVEKHIPIISENGNEITITIGEVLHPMLDDHYIAWIHVFTTTKEYHFDLEPNQKPQKTFIKENNEEIREVLIYCNLHGLWKNK